MRTHSGDGSKDSAKLAGTTWTICRLCSTTTGRASIAARGEFAGRPLDGNFFLRVWDTPNVDFNSIQDVQVLVNYRYWTRFN
jgi:hypothetical protein